MPKHSAHNVTSLKIGFKTKSSIDNVMLDIRVIARETEYRLIYCEFDPEKVAWFGDDHNDITWFRNKLTSVHLKHIEIIYINNIYTPTEQVMDTRIDAMSVLG